MNEHSQRPPRRGARRPARAPARDPARDPVRDIDDERQRVLAIVDSIPAGKVACYGQVAAEAGFPRRARWVGRILAELGPNSALAWHRVVAASGRISERPGRGPREQRKRLRAEGVEISSSGRIQLATFGWQPAWTSAPKEPT